MEGLFKFLTQNGLVSLLLLGSVQAAPSFDVSVSWGSSAGGSPSWLKDWNSRQGGWGNVRGPFVWMDDVNQQKTPELYRDFPDPSLIRGPDQWYAFATASSGKRVQYATAVDPAGPWTYVDKDLLPDPGSWTNGIDIWAPDVRMVDDGTYVMYYTGAMKNDTGIHCLGVATSSAITGPWAASDQYWHCDESLGGSIDSSGFVDTDGTRYVAYKIDENVLGNGGSCDNTVAPIKSTPLMLQQVEGDGITKVGEPVQILDRVDSDGPLIEAPNIIMSNEGKYILFFSSHCYTSADYNVLYAIADSVMGPYTRSTQPFLQSGMFNLTSPGGGTSTTTQYGTTMLFHGNCPTYVGGSNRCLYVSSFAEIGSKVLANRR